MFGDWEIDNESMTQVANKKENEDLFENCEMDNATLFQFVARFDMNLNLGVSDFFADLPLLPPTSGDLNVQAQTTTRRFATSTSEEDLNSLVQATK